jgi:uncharacterized alkaline shock family protein YloU
MPSAKTSTRKSTKTAKKPASSRTSTKVTTTKRKRSTKAAGPEKIEAGFDKTPVIVPDLPIVPDITGESPIEDISTSISEISPDPITRIFNEEGFDISKKVLARIALMAAGEIDGLLPPRKNPFFRILDTIQGRTEGIRVDVGTTEAAVDMLIRVQYGSRIPEITGLLRERVASRINEMTGLKVVEVNIRVQDVTNSFPTG